MSEIARTEIKEDYSESFTTESFWRKVAKYALKAGKEVIENALILFYVLQDDEVPVYAKGVVIAALGYFISPIDAIPDFLPGGYVDDLGVLVAALAAIATHVSDETINKAKAKMAQFFG